VRSSFPRSKTCRPRCPPCGVSVPQTCCVCVCVFMLDTVPCLERSLCDLAVKVQSRLSSSTCLACDVATPPPHAPASARRSPPPISTRRHPLLLSADLILANERCVSIEMEVRQEVSEEMATRLQELEERYRSMHAQESVAAEVRHGLLGVFPPSCALRQLELLPLQTNVPCHHRRRHTRPGPPFSLGRAPPPSHSPTYSTLTGPQA
jgi:hypothetical protein